MEAGCCYYCFHREDRPIKQMSMFPGLLPLFTRLPLPMFKVPDMCQTPGDGPEEAVVHVLSTLSQMEKTNLERNYPIVNDG